MEGSFPAKKRLNSGGHLLGPEVSGAGAERLYKAPFHAGMGRLDALLIPDSGFENRAQEVHSIEIMAEVQVRAPYRITVHRRC